MPRTLESYGLDYTEQPTCETKADQSIRASDRYVDTHDPLRATTAVHSRVAAVQLGVDPGTFFCGAQLAQLIQLRRRPGFDHTRVGFIHVPPDHSTGEKARAKPQLHDRATNLAMVAQVLAIALRGFTRVGAALVLTGFGPFAGVADNPTEAFLGDPHSLDHTIALAHPGAQLDSARHLSTNLGVLVGIRDYHIPTQPGHSQELRLCTVLLQLAPTKADALAGHYFDPDVVADHFTHAMGICCNALVPAAIVSLGVDSSQSTGTHSPRFKIETQTRGWQRGVPRGHGATKRFERNLELAQVFMSARSQRAPPLHYA